MFFVSVCLSFRNSFVQECNCVVPTQLHVYLLAAMNYHCGLSRQALLECMGMYVYEVQVLLYFDVRVRTANLVID